MSEAPKPEVGTIGWMDLTVDNARGIRDFYRQVVGWSVREVDMGGYSDFCMTAPGSGTTVAGICHARGANAELPAQWLMYITVEDLDASMDRCQALGGRVLTGPRGGGAQGRYCVIEDPAGAVVALHAPA